MADAAGRAAAYSLDALLTTMRAHKGSASIQLYGCKFLVKLALKPRDNQTVIAKAGAIKDVLTVMRIHLRGSASLQQHGCHALGNLAEQNADNQVAIPKAGGHRCCPCGHADTFAP